MFPRAARLERVTLTLVLGDNFDDAQHLPVVDVSRVKQIVA
jgi:hypothetical protein